MWLHNAIHTVKVTAYNEKDTVRDTGGLTKKEDNTSIELRILIKPIFGRFRQKEIGKFEEQLLNFQVSKSELNKKSFSIEIGKTHIIRNDIDYRVVQVKDASYDPGTQLYDCLAKKIMPVEYLI